MAFPFRDLVLMRLCAKRENVLVRPHAPRTTHGFFFRYFSPLSLTSPPICPQCCSAALCGRHRISLPYGLLPSFFRPRTSSPLPSSLAGFRHTPSSDKGEKGGGEDKGAHIQVCAESLGAVCCSVTTGDGVHLQGRQKRYRRDTTCSLVPQLDVSHSLIIVWTSSYSA